MAMRRTASRLVVMGGGSVGGIRISAETGGCHRRAYRGRAVAADLGAVLRGWRLPLGGLAQRQGDELQQLGLGAEPFPLHPQRRKGLMDAPLGRKRARNEAQDREAIGAG